MGHSSHIHKGNGVSLIPRDEKFYDLFREQAELVREAAQKLAELFENFQDVEKRVTEIEFIEHKGDQLTHSVMTKLNKTFITPIDREDIHALSGALDDALDLVDTVASRIVTYKIHEVTPGARQLTLVILHGAEIALKAVSELSKPANILDYCSQLTQLEKQADRIKTECVGRLFEDSRDPVEIIKWKELYEVLEATTDKLEDVGDVLESVVVKSA